MKGNALWVVFGAALLLLATRTRRKRRSRATQAMAAAEAKYLRNPVCPEHGLSIEGDTLEVVDWTRWMEFSNKKIRRAIAEGAMTPDHVVARLFYAAFPDGDWPPDTDSPLADKYNEIVATVSENLDDMLRPIRIEWAKKQGLGHGLRLVD